MKSIKQSINQLLFAQLRIQHDIAIKKWTGTAIAGIGATQYSILQNYLIFVVVTMLWSI